MNRGTTEFQGGPLIAYFETPKRAEAETVALAILRGRRMLEEMLIKRYNCKGGSRHPATRPRLPVFDALADMHPRIIE